MRFRLLIGQYIGNDPRTGSERHYFQGEIVECAKDLSKMGGADKFERLPDAPFQLTEEEARRMGYIRDPNWKGPEQSHINPSPMANPISKPTKSPVQAAAEAGFHPESHKTNPTTSSPTVNTPAQEDNPPVVHEEGKTPSYFPPGTKPPQNDAEWFKLFNSMTVAQLREFADVHEIDLTGATRKEDIIRVIKQSGEED